MMLALDIFVAFLAFLSGVLILFNADPIDESLVRWCWRGAGLAVMVCAIVSVLT